MSLIICPECQKEVSSKAEVCPHCGVKIAGNVKRCPKCKSFVLMDAEQCPTCHTRFVVLQPHKDDAPEQSPIDVPAEEIAATTTAGVSVILDEATDATPTVEQSAEPMNEANNILPAEESDSSTPPQDEIPVPKKNGSSPWWLLILGILVIAIGGFFYWENQNQEKAEEQAYILLENCNNPLNYEDFIARFPNSPHIDNVRARLQELQREDAAWLEISSKMDVQQLQEFVDKHPSSPHKKAALQKIDSLDWKQAERIGTAAAYDAYIMKHENGEFIDQALSAREAARTREERARRDSIAAAAADTLAAADATLPAAQ